MAIACLDAPPSFRLVGLDRARELLRSGSVTLLEALASGEAAGPKLPGAIVWRLQPDARADMPELPSGPVLVIASSQSLAYRAAADLARDGNRTVHVLITASAAERGTLYALDPQPEETPSGRDS